MTASKVVAADLSEIGLTSARLTSEKNTHSKAVYLIRSWCGDTYEAFMLQDFKSRLLGKMQHGIHSFLCLHLNTVLFQLSVLQALHKVMLKSNKNRLYAV